MTALSNYAENELLDHLLGTGAFTAPTNTYLQFHTGSPGEDCTANVATTSTRQLLSWAAAASRAISTNAAVTATAAADETITHFSVWDALTSGNPMVYGAFSSPIPANNTDTITIGSGQVTIDFTTITSAISTYAGNAILDHLTGRSAMTAPTDVYVQLHTGAPGLAGTANVATTSTRVDAGAFSAASGGATDNDAAVAFTGAATETISHFSLWDASTSGNNLWGDAVTDPKDIVSAQAVQFAAGALALALA